MFFLFLYITVLFLLALGIESNTKKENKRSKYKIPSCLILSDNTSKKFDEKRSLNIFKSLLTKDHIEKVRKEVTSYDFK